MMYAVGNVNVIRCKVYLKENEKCDKCGHVFSKEYIAEVNEVDEFVLQKTLDITDTACNGFTSFCNLV